MKIVPSEFLFKKQLKYYFSKSHKTEYQNKNFDPQQSPYISQSSILQQHSLVWK